MTAATTDPEAPTDATRAELYARSAHAARHNAKLRDLFTARGIALAGDQWPELYYRATGETAPEPATPTVPSTGPLSRPCPQCKSAAGVKCRNYTGANCAPHAARTE